MGGEREGDRRDNDKTAMSDQNEKQTGRRLQNREELFIAGLALALQFCTLNKIKPPLVQRLNSSQRNYHIGTCAYYRPTTINIMVEKCANRGFGGRAWSWPGYAIDRTPYGVIQHELGHHVDYLHSTPAEGRFSQQIFECSKEKPLTGYLGTDKNTETFFMEWFAENFRLFVTNPDLSFRLRPKFYGALVERGICPLDHVKWDTQLRCLHATDRIVEQARKKIHAS